VRFGFEQQYILAARDAGDLTTAVSAIYYSDQKNPASRSEIVPRILK